MTSDTNSKSKKDPGDFGTWSALEIGGMIVQVLLDGEHFASTPTEAAEEWVARVISTWMEDSVRGALSSSCGDEYD